MQNQSIQSVSGIGRLFKYIKSVQNLIIALTKVKIAAVVVPLVTLVRFDGTESLSTVETADHSVTPKHRERVLYSRSLDRCVDVILDDLRSIRVGAPTKVACDTIFRVGIGVTHGSFRTTARLLQQPGQILSNSTVMSRDPVLCFYAILWEKPFGIPNGKGKHEARCEDCD